MPSRIFNSPGLRNAGVATSIFLNNVAPAFSAPAANLAGFSCAPFALPDSWDVSRPADVYLAISNPIANATPSLAVVFQFDLWWASPDGVPNTFNYQLVWPVPNPWPAQTIKEIRLTSDTIDPPQPTVDGGTLSPSSIFAIRAVRDGNAPSDTYPNQVNMLAYLKFAYPLRCQKLCCP